MAKDESKRKDTTPNLMEWEKLLHAGENPKGFTAQTCNGTAKFAGTGWNRQFGCEQEQLVPEGPWKAGRSNRTGE